MEIGKGQKENWKPVAISGILRSRNREYCVTETLNKTRSKKASIALVVVKKNMNDFTGIMWYDKIAKSCLGKIRLDYTFKKTVYEKESLGHLPEIPRGILKKEEMVLVLKTETGMLPSLN